MSGTDHAGAPPPEVPEEFADAYREAYRRALESGSDVDAELGTGLPEVPPQEVVVVGTHRSDGLSHQVRRTVGWTSARWFLPAVIGASALVLVIAAYAVGSALSGDDGKEPPIASPSAAHTSASGKAGSPDQQPAESEPSTSPGGWKGDVDPVSVAAISADCTAPASNDSAGHRVTYVPENAIDRKTATAWRCTGTAVGQKLTLRMNATADVAEVGLVPGYAKTDRESGADRYAENNRITRVRWTLADGVTVVQRLDPDPSSRAVQLLRVPPTDTDTITLEILAVRRGPRNTTAISQIVVRSAA